MAWWVWLIIVAVILIGGLIALYIVGNKLQKKAVCTEGNDEGTGTACDDACHRQEDAPYEGCRIA